MLRCLFCAACGILGARHDPRRVPARSPQAKNPTTFWPFLVLETATGGGVGRTKTMHVAPHVSQAVVPRLHGLRAPWWPRSWHPPRAKTAKTVSLASRRARLPEKKWGCYFPIIKFEFFSETETLRAHGAPCPEMFQRQRTIL